VYDTLVRFIDQQEALSGKRRKSRCIESRTYFSRIGV